MATITLADLMNDKKPSHNGNSNGDGIEGVIKRTSSGMPRRQHRYTRSNGTLMGCCEKCGGILASFDKVENNKLVCSSCGHGNDYDVERYNKAAAETSTTGSATTGKAASSKVISLDDLA